MGVGVATSFQFPYARMKCWTDYPEPLGGWSSVVLAPLNAPPWIYLCSRLAYLGKRLSFLRFDGQGSGRFDKQAKFDFDRLLSWDFPTKCSSAE